MSPPYFLPLDGFTLFRFGDSRPPAPIRVIPDPLRFQRVPLPLSLVQPGIAPGFALSLLYGCAPEKQSLDCILAGVSAHFSSLWVPRRNRTPPGFQFGDHPHDRHQDHLCTRLHFEPPARGRRQICPGHGLRRRRTGWPRKIDHLRREHQPGCLYVLRPVR